MQDPEEAADAGEWRPRAGDGVSNELLVLEPKELHLETADVRHQMSMARMRLIVKYSRSEAVTFDKMNVKDQLRIARQLPFKGLEGRPQGNDRFQDAADDP